MTACTDKYAEYIRQKSSEIKKVNKENIKGGGCKMEIVEEVNGKIAYVTIVWHPDIKDEDAHLVRGRIRQKWLDVGGIEELGYPLTDESETRDNKGRYNDFQKGSIYYHKGKDEAFIIRGRIRKKWRNMDDVVRLGYPVVDERVIGKDGRGRYNDFKSANEQEGDVRSIYSHPIIGTYLVRGAIRDRWINEGWVNKVGYPITDEKDYIVKGEKVGRISHFQKGEIIFLRDDGRTHYNKRTNKGFNTRVSISIILGLIWAVLSIYAFLTKNYILFGILLPPTLIVALVTTFLEYPLRRFARKLFGFDDGNER